MSTEHQTTDPNDTFAKMGKTYQEKVVQALLQDYSFADQMSDVISPRFFDLKYLQAVVEKFYENKKKHRTYPSPDLLEIMLTREDESDQTLVAQIKSFLDKHKTTPLNGDTGYIQTTSLDFCRKQSLKVGILKAIDMMESGNFDSVQGIIRDALTKGATRDLGHEYLSDEGFQARAEDDQDKSPRIPTGWPVMDKIINGGWKRRTLATFIAATGAGKSMFLVNCGAAAALSGANVLYVSLELDEKEIGRRFDAYYSGVEINSVVKNFDKVREQVKEKAKGRVIIKEFNPKSISAQGIRGYLEKLRATREFVPDVIIVDYADLLRGTGQAEEGRFELANTYIELRAIAKETNAVVITADQTNRSGLDSEIVLVSQIGEAYAKATHCDLIFTISRRETDKTSNQGRILFAKSRLGPDGMVHPFQLNTATVKVTILDRGEDPLTLFAKTNETLKETMAERYLKLSKSAKQ